VSAPGEKPSQPRPTQTAEAAANGLCAITMPFVFPVHCPPDYTRFTPEGLAWLVRSAG